jgi:hypothetical protein
MAKVTAAQKAAAEAQAAELKATAVLEANEASSSRRGSSSNTRRFRDGSIRRCSRS